MVTEVERMSVGYVHSQQAKGRDRYGKGLDENDVPNVTNLCEELADALQYACAHKLRLNNLVDEVIEEISYCNYDCAIELLKELKNE